MKFARIVAIIPARGGSKGIPRKNVLPLAGKPLIVHSIEQAEKSSCITLTVVSTNDDEIARVSEEAGAKVIRRPDEICGDTASSESALIHAIKALAFEEIIPDLVVFLQCTSPIRRAGDIDLAVATLVNQNADSLLSVSPNHRFLWTEVDGQAKPINYDFRHRPRRQDMTPQFVENGSIYVFRPEGLLETGNRLFGKVVLYRMGEEAAIDIDSPSDMLMAEILIANHMESDR